MKIAESQIRQLVRKIVKEANGPEEKLAMELEKIEKAHQAELMALEAKKQRAIELAHKKWSTEEVNKRAERAKATYSPDAVAARQAVKDATEARWKAVSDANKQSAKDRKKCAECGNELTTASELSRYQYDDGPRWYCDDHNKSRNDAYNSWRSEGNKYGF
jgi:hypothetical protein